MRVVFFGTPQFAVPTLEALINHPQLELLGVVTQPDKRRGRGNKLTPSPVKEIALNHNLPVWQPTRVKKDKKILNILQETNADVFVVIAYGQILSTQILNMPKQGCINVHGSILPKYRGAAPIQWSIYNGDRQTGITTMLMDEGMDTGPMLLKAYTNIGILDHSEDIAKILANQGAQLLIDILLQLPTLTPIPQDNDQANYARLLEKSDYQLDWCKKARELHNQVRAFFPNCYTFWGDKEIKIIKTIPLLPEYASELPESISRLIPQFMNLKGDIGEIVGLVKGIGPVIQTGEGILLLQEVQLSGKRPQSGFEFINGNRLKTGEKIFCQKG